MQQAICRLAPIVLTTNYDCLLENASGYATLTWRQTNEIRDAIGSNVKPNVVIHLHGAATDPRSVVLGSWQYQALRDDTTAQFLQSTLISTRRLLFIGCGDGLDDPNIAPALEYAESLDKPGVDRNGPAQQPWEHFVLVRGLDLAAAIERLRGRPILPVAYGREYRDLEPFLVSLVRTPLRPSQDPHDYQVLVRTEPRRGLLDLAGPADDAIQQALDLVQRALRAVGQVERRSALPVGFSGWGMADQLSVHERTAASVKAPADRLHDEVAALTSAVQAAEAPMGLLVAEDDQRLAGLFRQVDELRQLCQQLDERVGACSSQLSEEERPSDSYRPARQSLQHALALAHELTGTVGTLLRTT